jgi:hypothetical protein
VGGPAAPALRNKKMWDATSAKIQGGNEKHVSDAPRELASAFLVGLVRLIVDDPEIPE